MTTLVSIDLCVWDTTVCLKQVPIDEARRITRRVVPMLLLSHVAVKGDVQHWVFRLNFRSWHTWLAVAETLRDKTLRRLSFKQHSGVTRR